MQSALSPKELAHALGVSESSIKRWIDDGRLDCTRTPGGHRRITIQNALKFIRREAADVNEFGLLGIVPTNFGQLPPADEIYDYLHDGKAKEARSLIMTAYLSGKSISEVVDEIVSKSMARLGELWQTQEDGIFLEHRASEICHEALTELRMLSNDPIPGLTAIGGAPEYDPYRLPSHAAAIVLESLGYTATDLGAFTPTDTLVTGAESVEANLVWMSVSWFEEYETLLADVRRLSERLPETPIILGGHAVRDDFNDMPNVTFGCSMSELQSFAEEIAAAPIA